MALTKEEIKQLHNNLKVSREFEIAKSKFVVRSFTWGDEEDFVQSFSDINQKMTDVFVSNFIASEIVKRCLVSFDNEVKTEEEVENFSAEKINFILEKYRELSDDIAQYLSDFPEQELALEELEEYILTDRIERTINLSHEEDVHPIKIKFKMLNLKESKEVGKEIGERIDELERPKKIQIEHINNDCYARKVLVNINGIKVSKEFLNSVSVELVKFILNRLSSLEEDIKEKLGTGDKAAEVIKN